MDELDAFLVGQRLSDSWIIQSPYEVQRDAASSCRCYIANHVDGKEAFVKVLDPRAHGSLEEAQRQLERFIYERHVSDICATRNMRRVIRVVSHGAIRTPEPFSMSLHYLLFEWGPHDVRSFMHPDERVHIGTTLRWIHHTTTALHELHFSEIAHQDLRPAHVMVMPNMSAKVGGLGNSHNHKAPAGFTTSVRDLTYRAPEVLYRRPPRTIDDRFACDMYALGSLASFLLSGLSMNVELTRALDPMHHWTRWRGDFSEALPYIIEPFDEVIVAASSTLTWEESGRLVSALRQLCHPDPAQRGHPTNRQGAGSRYGLERYVSLFDLLASRMEWQERKAG